MMSYSSFSGNVAIVTAFTDGIGLPAARVLGRSGPHIVVSSHRQDNVDKVVLLLCSENIQVTGTRICVTWETKRTEKKMINIVKHSMEIWSHLEMIFTRCFLCRLWSSVAVLTYWSLMQL